MSRRHLKLNMCKIEFWVFSPDPSTPPPHLSNDSKISLLVQTQILGIILDALFLNLHIQVISESCWLHVQHILDAVCFPLPPLIELWSLNNHHPPLGRFHGLLLGLLVPYALAPAYIVHTTARRKMQTRSFYSHASNLPSFPNFPHYSPAALVILLCLEQAKSAPVSGPLHVLFSLPRMLFLQILTCLMPSPHSPLNSMPLPQRGLS